MQHALACRDRPLQTLIGCKACELRIATQMMIKLAISADAALHDECVAEEPRVLQGHSARLWHKSNAHAVPCGSVTRRKIAGGLTGQNSLMIALAWGTDILLSL